MNQDNNGKVVVAIISDTHSVLDERIADVIRSADIAVHAGDIGDAKVLDLMRPRSGRVIAVTGNNDHPVLWPAAQTERLQEIPQQVEFELPGGSIAIEHGDRHHSVAPDHQSLRDAHPRARVIVYGHTHRMVIDDDCNPWVVNPGAAGNTRTGGGASCLMLQASDNEPWTIESIRFAD